MATNAEIQLKTYAKIAAHPQGHKGSLIKNDAKSEGGVYNPLTEQYAGATVQTPVDCAVIFDTLPINLQNTSVTGEIKASDKFCHLAAKGVVPNREDIVALPQGDYEIISEPLEETAGTQALYKVYMRLNG